MSLRYRLGAQELLELGRVSIEARGPREPFFARRRMGANDIALEARLNLGESFGAVLTAISKVVRVTPEAMAASPKAAKEYILLLIKNSPTMENYVLGLLVLASVIVKEGVRAIGPTQEQVSNILVGAGEAVMEVVPESELPERLLAAENRIIEKTPEGLREKVRQMISGSGISPGNLAPNLPEPEKNNEDAAGAAGMTAGQKALLVGIPVSGFVAIGLMSR